MNSAGPSSFAEVIQEWSDDRLTGEMARTSELLRVQQVALRVLMDELARRYAPCGTEPRCGACPECLDMAFATVEKGST